MNTWIVRIGLLMAALVSLFFIFVYVEHFILDDAEDGQYCKSQSQEYLCYNNAVDICKMVWRQYSTPCEAEVKAKRGQRRVTSLLGPGIKRCIQKKFDKTLRSSRKLSGGNSCQEYFSKLDAMSLD
ncbi:MAG: hypothetical protein JNM39_16610 [Bdellovibrionaceae bacterium]|nr:hypothetical protein [Pseudobdellovibrionaceae bacterium]